MVHGLTLHRQTGPHICELQLRPAQHQPQTLKLEDGTALHEPPGVEGYLVRQKSSVAPKESVYVSSHDGTYLVTQYGGFSL